MCEDSELRGHESGRICDTCLGERVARALRTSGRLTARNLGVLARDGDILLHGELSTFYEKQIAQEIAMSIDEVRRVRNEAAVRPPVGNGSRGSEA